ncbi:hypothetical protein [Methanolobus psychrotolerans]|uniref:hypothetical protein n=1 Tax=Methanolobus psychrotolerans TaxID=1874706 RepID=UPI000B91C8A4|nr:hypothetical protein [Methanolobus psychrotolerans]
MTFRHHVSELVAINGTKSWPKSQSKLRPESGPSGDHVGTKSGPSWDQVIFKSPTQLSTQSPTQLHKISLPNYCIRSVTDQVGEQVTEHVIEQVSATNHRGHRDIADEITNLQICHKPCDELTTQQMIYTIRYPMGNELNTAFNPQLDHIVVKIEVNYDN